jgi:hypothetical protein
MYFSFVNLSERMEFVALDTNAFTQIKDADFIFENSLVRIVVNRNCPEIELAGLKVGPYEEGKEYEVKYWTATELERAGIARFREEELLDIRRLDRTLWNEKVQQTRQVSHIEEDFYPRLRRFLSSLRRGANNNSEKIVEYRKAMDTANDIVNVRLRKIVYLASSPEQTDQTLKDFAKEERTLYDCLFTIINDWKGNILKVMNEQ